MIFCFRFCSVHSIGYNFHSTFCLQFRLEINCLFQIHFSVRSKQRALDFEHVFRCSQFSHCSFAQFNPVCSYIFVCVTFQPSEFFFCSKLAATKRVFVLRPAGLFTFFFSGATTRRSRNHFPTLLGGFCTPRTGGAITGATDAVPISSTGTTTEVGPLTSSLPSRGQSSGGALWTPAYTLTDRLTSWGVLHHPFTVPV